MTAFPRNTGTRHEFSQKQRNIKTCAGGLKGGSIRVFDVESGRLRHGWDGRWGPVRSLAYSPDGKRLASVGLEVKLWDPVSFQELLTLPAPRQTGWSLSWSPDGHSLAVAGGALKSPGEAQVWSIEPGSDPIGR